VRPSVAVVIAATRARRWLAPLVVVAVVWAGVGTWRTRRALAAAPAVGPRSAQQVAALATGAAASPAHSGSFRITTHLGLPDLGPLGRAVLGAGPGGPGAGGPGPGGGGALGLPAAGTNEARVWTDGGDRWRVALLTPLAEADWVRTGDQLWQWRSIGQLAGRLPYQEVPALGLISALATPVPVEPPEKLAARLLAQRDATTTLTLGPPRRVAGRAAYDLRLAPHTAGSLVREVDVAVDAATGLALAVAVVATNGSTTVDDAYTAIHLGQPPARRLAFTRPPHAVDPTRVVLAGPDRRVVRRRIRRFEPGPFAPGQAGPVPLAGISLAASGWGEVVVASTGPGARFALAGMLQAGTPVAGPFGTGRVLRTPLVTVVALDDGRLAVGAVAPAQVEAALGGPS
jgi:hypothetical protein